jgi:hypothetical protein
MFGWFDMAEELQYRNKRRSMSWRPSENHLPQQYKDL